MGSVIRATRRRGAGTTFPHRSHRACWATRSRPSKTSRRWPRRGAEAGSPWREPRPPAGTSSARRGTPPWPKCSAHRAIRWERELNRDSPSASTPTIVELLRTIEAHLTEGYRRVKIKIAPGRDVELVRAVRQHFGDIPLMVDANAAYCVDDLDLFRALDDFDLLMFEQPMAAGDIDGMVALQAEVSTPVCIDETADTLEQAGEAIRRGACKIVNIKLQRVGGFGPALALHDLCHEHGIACWIGSMPELGIGQAQGIHLAALGNCRYPTDVEPSARWFVDDYVVPLIELSAPGVLSLPTRPGLGYMVDAAKVRRYQVRQREFVAKASS